MFGARWPRLLNAFRRKTLSELNHCSKRFRPKQDGSSESESFWSQMFGKYLLVTNTVTTGLLLGIGDAVAQHFEGLGERKPFDYSRSRSMIITGLVIGPVQHGFYFLLDRFFTGNTSLLILKKILVDQFVMSPTYILMFFYISSLLEGLSIRECNAEMSEKFVITWALDCCFWPAFQYLNFRYLSAIYRVVFINLANCAHVVLLSYIKHATGKTKHVAQGSQGK